MIMRLLYIAVWGDAPQMPPPQVWPPVAAGIQRLHLEAAAHHPHKICRCAATLTC